MNTDFEKLKAHLAQIGDLQSTLSLLFWDQATYLPEAAHNVRAAQISTLTQLAHQLSVSRELGNLIERCIKHLPSLDLGSFEVALVRVAERDFIRNTQVPETFMAEMSQHHAETYSVWARAREANDFSIVRGRLEKTLDLSRRHAAYFRGFDEPLDALIHGNDPGMKTQEIRRLFAELRQELVPLLKKVTERPRRPSPWNGKSFSIEKQKELSRRVISDIGYPWSRGRMDDTHHPFMVRMASDDCRITVRSKDTDPIECLASAVHEAGHALYELGIDSHYDRTPLGSGASMSLHESQSRFWENIIMRSRPFWNHYYPLMREFFPEALRDVSEDEFVAEVNRVEPSLIRTQADELTYNLHVMIRFDLEADMLSGKLPVAQLPEAWNARYASDLGIQVPGDNVGCLQDMHWYAGGIGGYFQSYTLGNIISGTLLAQAEKDLPHFWQEVEQAKFGGILTWLRNNIHRHGRRFDTHEILQKVSGHELRVEPFVAYLKRKYV